MLNWKWFLLVLLLSLGLIFISPVGVTAAPRAQVVDVQPEYTFGVEIRFRGTLQSEIPVASASLFLQADGQKDAAVLPAQIDPQGEILVVYDLKQRPLRAFSTIYYWFYLTLENGESLTSPSASFYYLDNRFEWQTLKSEPFEVFWHMGDAAFAQEVLNVAHAGLARARDFLPLSYPQAVRIYVYAGAQELQDALLLSGQTWVAGHADPDLNVILVSLPPGPEQHLEMERQIPHELMHVLLYHADPAAYDRLPAWLVEGLASVTELYPNPDYQVLLESAYAREGLLPIASLCKVFPRDANGALLAYAQSTSFTRYLYRQFGTPGLERLVNGYSQGLSCERGFEEAFSSSLPRLENDWRLSAFSENAWLTALEKLLPWIVLLFVVLAGPLFFIMGSLRRRPPAPTTG